MNEARQTKAQLLAELQQLRQHIAVINQDITERERTERALRQSEELNRRVFEATPGGIVQISSDGVVVRANLEAQRILGISFDTLTSQFVADFEGQTLWEDGTACEPKDHPIAKCLQTNQPQPPVTLGLNRPDGTLVWVIFAAIPLADPETGQMMGAVVTLFDITERKNTERREKLAYELGQQLTTLLDPDLLLQRTVNRLREVFDYYYVQVYLLDGVASPDTSKEIKEGTLILRAGTGEVGAELKRRNHLLTVEAKQSIVARAARLLMPVVVNDVRRNPSFLPNPLLPNTRAEVAIPLVVDQHLIGVLDVQHNIHNYFNVDRVRNLQIVANQLSIALSNAQLFADNARRLAIIENSYELIALANIKDGLIIYINPAGARLLGYEKPEEIIGKPVSHFYTLEAIARIKNKILPRVFKQGVWRTETQLRRLDGTLVPVDQTLFAIPDKQGQPQTIAGIISDITERKRAETERVAMQATMFQNAKLVSVGELASGVAHEINNPLYAIREFADMMMEDAGPDSPNYFKLQTIVHAADRIAEIVRNLLNFARPSEVNFSPTHLRDVWRLTSNLIGQSFLKHNILLAVDIPADLPEIQARPQQLQQVLLNLVTNAQDALTEKYPTQHPNKRITITAQLTEDVRLPLSRARQRSGNSVIHLTVRDEGVGIPSEYRERLFTPFFTTKRPNRGTGLGLSISHKIIEDHHGRIEVNSEPGKFTEFIVILPVNGNGTEESAKLAV